MCRAPPRNGQVRRDARAASMTPDRRAEIAKPAAATPGRASTKSLVQYSAPLLDCSASSIVPKSASMGMAMTDSPQQLGGQARSRSLPAQERSRIAREAAKARWGDASVSAIAGSPDNPIRVGGIEVPCYVLDDERRVIATNGVLDALEMARGGAMIKGMNRLELFAAQNRLSGFVSKDSCSRESLARSSSVLATARLTDSSLICLSNSLRR